MNMTRLVPGILVAGALLVMGPGHLGAGEAPSRAKQTVAGGGVTVDVTLLKERGDAPTFQVVLDTHSLNLDGYRFEEIVRLRDGRGGELAPAAVEGAKGSGHHREATVRFAWPEPKPRELELIVK
ncbi:MAG: hypothetical protein HY766_08320, partial [candidate division NC10 bacterium]|nr:hypothetical protein [candidate division NC10 bacterium]